MLRQIQIEQEGVIAQKNHHSPITDLEGHGFPGQNYVVPLVSNKVRMGIIEIRSAHKHDGCLRVDGFPGEHGFSGPQFYLKHRLLALVGQFMLSIGGNNHIHTHPAQHSHGIKNLHGPQVLRQQKSAGQKPDQKKPEQGSRKPTERAEVGRTQSGIGAAGILIEYLEQPDRKKTEK